MSFSSPDSLAPTYVATLRPILSTAFGPPGLVPENPLPGGTLLERLEAWKTWTPGEILLPTPEVDQDYWVLSIPHRVLLTGPLLHVAQAPIASAGKRKVEREMLRTYYRSCGACPLSPDLLDLVAAQDDPVLSRWLEGASQRIMASSSVGDAKRDRAAYRAHALRQGATEAWQQSSTAVAELMTDVYCLLRGVRDDVDRALTQAASEGGSVGEALAAANGARESALQRVLTHMAEPVVTQDDYPPAEREMMIRFAAERPSGETESLLAVGGPGVETLEASVTEPPRPTSQVLVTQPAAERPSQSAPADDPIQPPTDPRAEYRRLVQGLEARILGRPQLCRDLALVGLASACGIGRQRVLLCGPSGSGKSHSAQALADVLDRPSLRLHTPDVTTTGFRGIEISTALESLASRGGDSLRGSLLILDEIDKVRVADSALDGNSRAAQMGLMASLMHLLDGSPVTLDDLAAEQLDTAGLVVVGAGAFQGRFRDRPPTTRDLEDWGWMPEFARRWTSRLVLSPPGALEAAALLRSSERSVRGQLGPLMDALGLSIEIPEATIQYAVHHWHHLETDLRSAAAWLAGAARREIIGALEADSETELVIHPDDLEISRGH